MDEKILTMTSPTVKYVIMTLVAGTMLLGTLAAGLAG
jgi:hypothetical protein